MAGHSLVRVCTVGSRKDSNGRGLVEDDTLESDPEASVRFGDERWDEFSGAQTVAALMPR
jgi:hypothetical protein